ncbi:P-loop containing nucleoside triphosphate hydrolase protein [Tirmania nivea]|nr:P-loop containing nucleoside triphosphate hydrolase protein [Tirmania nivea]
MKSIYHLRPLLRSGVNCICSNVPRRSLSTSAISHHENPLGLPRAGSPPSLPRMQRGLPQKRRVPHITKTILVSSAKGGVGKSTIAVNIATAAALGLHTSPPSSTTPPPSSPSLHPKNRPLRVGLLDLDIFGPSIPTLLNLSGPGHEPSLNIHNQLLPLTNHGVRCMSMGFLLPEGAPVAWRGLMVMKAVQQLMWEVDWSGRGGEDLDLLVVDMPPGTGDVQLSVGQQLVVDGAVIVTTPQDIALIDAVKGVNMFRKLNIPILGLTLNMSHYTCPTCSTPHNIFGRGPDSVNKACQELEIDVLANVPLEARICEDADDGRPTVVRDSAGEVGRVIGGLVKGVVGKLWNGDEEK